MKILQLAIQAQGGGAEKVANVLHKEFMTQEESWICFLSENLKMEISNSIYLKLPKNKVFMYILGVIRFSKVAYNLKPDITVLHCEPSMAVAALTPGIGKLFIVEHQPFIWRGFKALVIKGILRILKARGAQIIYLRNNRALREGGVYIPNPLEMKDVRDSCSTPSSKFQLVYVGRLAFDKGFDRLPEILAISREENLLVFGEGKLRNEVVFQKTQVTFHGFVPNLWERIPQNSLLLIPSRWEGDGLVILEALYRNIPFLVMKFDSIEELPIPLSSMCIDEREMAEKIRRLRLDVSLFSELLDSDIREKIAALRNPGIISKRYLETFREAVGS